MTVEGRPERGCGLWDPEDARGREGVFSGRSLRVSGVCAEGIEKTEKFCRQMLAT